MKKFLRIQLITALLANVATRWANHVQEAARKFSHRCSQYTRSRRGIDTGASKRPGEGKSTRRCTFGHNKRPHTDRQCHRLLVAVARRPILLTMREKVSKVEAFRVVFPKGTYFLRRTPAVPVERHNGGWKPVGVAA